jgi:23S rRNA-/tRNA-specific pseudouridylate synthase
LPIVNDYLYGSDEGWQMQLSAYMLTFVDCDGKDVRCVMP